MKFQSQYCANMLCYTDMLFLNESIADWHKYSHVNITSTLHYILMFSRCNVYVYKCMYTTQHI